MLEAIVTAALYAVLASLVLGAVLGAIVFAIVRSLALSAAIRHSLWTIALIATAIMPLATFGVSVQRAVSAQPVPAAALTASTRSGPSRSETPVDVRRPQRSQITRSSAGSSGAAAMQVPAEAFSAFRRSDMHLTRTLSLAIVAVWLAGALAGFVGLVGSLIRVRGLKRRSSPLEGQLADDLPWLTENSAEEREIYLRLSYEIETPVAIGFRRPVILIPTELATASGLGEIETLVMHEHAHLRRYDDWTNLIQRIIERLFWFNPLVWIVGRRIALEREIASDEAVVARTGHAKEYATSLWRLAREMRMPEHAVVAPGAMLTRKQITIRIETLLSGRAAIPALGPVAAIAIVGAALLSVAAVASSAPALQLPAPAAPVLAAATPAPATSAFTLSIVTEREMAARAQQRLIDERESQHAHAPDAELPPHPDVSVPAADGKRAGAKAIQAPVFAFKIADETPAPKPPAHPVAPATVADAPRAIRIAIDGAGVEISKSIDRAWAQGMSEIPKTIAQTDSRDSQTVPHNIDLATLAQIIIHCNGCNMSGRDLRGIDLRGATLTGINFADADLRNARLDGVRLNGVNLSDVKLDGASLVNAKFYGVNISDVSFRGAKTTGMRLVGSSFADMDLRGLDMHSILDGCVGCNLNNVNLQGADLHGITLIGANLSDANLRNANLAGAKLNGTNFEGADLTGVDFTNASLNGCNFSGATLKGVHLDGAHLEGANLGSD